LDKELVPDDLAAPRSSALIPLKCRGLLGIPIPPLIRLRENVSLREPAPATGPPIRQVPISHDAK
jgi:hypothetical protein